MIANLRQEAANGVEPDELARSTNPIDMETEGWTMFTDDDAST